MLPSERLRERHLALPPAPTPKGSYVPAWNDGNHVYVSGQIVTDGDAARSPGRVGREVDPATAKELARIATLQAVSAAAAVAGGSVDHLRAPIRVGVFVASADGFDRQHEVANGATEALAEVFGEEHRPVRVAVGVVALPLNAPVEVELLVELA